MLGSKRCICNNTREKKFFTKTLLEFIKYCNILYQKLDFYLRFIHWQIPDMIYADTIVKSSTALTYFGGI